MAEPRAQCPLCNGRDTYPMDRQRVQWSCEASGCEVDRFTPD